MFCPYCGAQMDGYASFCSKCGKAVSQQPAQQQPSYQQPAYQQKPSYQQPAYQQPAYQQPAYQQPVYQQPAYQHPAYGQNLSWKEFYDRFASKNTKSGVTWMVVICFFTAAVSVLLLFLLGQMLSILDIVVYTFLGILLVTQKRMVYALIPTIYGAIWSVVTLVSSGTLSGAVAIAAGILCMKNLSKLEKAYTEYQATGICPTMPI